MTCHERPSGTILARHIQSSASMLLCSNNTPSGDLRKILGKMVVDDVSQVIKGDDLISKFGNKLCVKLRKDGDQQHHISNNLREPARLVLETRKCCDSVSTLSDCLIPKHFGFIIEAMTELCGWDEDEGKLRCSSIGVKLGHSLRKCSKILHGDGIMKGSKSLVNQAHNFTTLLDLNWNDEISRIACRELEQRKWNKPNLLPLTSDLQVLQKHLKRIQSDSINRLANNNDDVKMYRHLCTSILAILILFNLRRGGEPALLTIKYFDLRGASVINEEVKKKLFLHLNCSYASYISKLIYVESEAGRYRYS